MLRMIVFSLMCCATVAFGRRPDADMTVSLDGRGDFASIQEAIDSVENYSNKRTVIYLENGSYDEEKLIVPESKRNITLLGEDRDDTVIEYHVYDSDSEEAVDGKCPPESVMLWSGDVIRTSATLTIKGEGFRAENLTIANTAGPVGQAQAITVQADRTVFVNCELSSYQDTIYLWSAGCRTYFKNCLVIGRTDYIYGAGIGYFDGCEIRSWGGGWITAPATPEDQEYGFVFYECDITYENHSPRDGDDGRPFRFGRPWHRYPKVAWIYCDLDGMLHPEGWGDTWRMDYAATSEDLHLYEYENKGKGADMDERADWAGLRELEDSEVRDYSVRKVLSGDDHWDPLDD